MIGAKQFEGTGRWEIDHDEKGYAAARKGDAAKGIQ